MKSIAKYTAIAVVVATAGFAAVAAHAGSKEHAHHGNATEQTGEPGKMMEHKGQHQHDAKHGLNLTAEEAKNAGAGQGEHSEGR